MTTKDDLLLNNDEKTSSCLSCDVGKRIVPKAALSIEEEKDDCISLSNSVRLNPCGCRFCKDCFIQYLAQTRDDPVLLCPDCGSVVASHRTTITQRCDTWAKPPPSKGSDLSLTSRVVVGVVEHHYCSGKEETRDVDGLDTAAGSASLNNSAQAELDDAAAPKALKQEEQAEGDDPDESTKGNKPHETTKGDDPDESTKGDDDPDESTKGDDEADEPTKGDDEADEPTKGDDEPDEPTKGVDEPDEPATAEQTSTPKTATPSAKKRTKSTKIKKTKTKTKTSYNPGGVPTIRSARSQQKPSYNPGGVPTIRSWKKRSAPSSAREDSPSPVKKYRRFDDHFEDLVKFKVRYGVTWVPHQYEDMALARWYHDIRLGKRKVSDEQKERLDSIGFHWGDKPKKSDLSGPTTPKRPYRTFDDHFQELLEYKEKYGNCLVPVNHSNKSSLERWAHEIRKGYRKLSEEEKIKLDAVGFHWDNIMPTDVKLHPDQKAKLGRQYKPRKSFDERLMDLIEYKKENGDCYVPYAYKERQNLGEWVKDVRRGQIKVSKERRKKLNEIGFVWETKSNRLDREWQERLEKLKDYKQAHGGLNVPRTEYYKSLSDWCGTQRKLNNKGILRADRKALLDELGFSWGGGRNSTGGGDDDEGRRSEDASDDGREEINYQHPTAFDNMFPGDRVTML